MTRRLFADTWYWVGRTNPRDQWHGSIMTLEQELRDYELVTSELVLAEFLSYFSHMGSHWRRRVCSVVDGIRQSGKISVIGHPIGGFDAGLSVYRVHEDKSWSLADCSSISIMRLLGISEVISNDHHFEQAGFSLLR